MWSCSIYMAGWMKCPLPPPPPPTPLPRRQGTSHCSCLEHCFLFQLICDICWHRALRSLMRVWPSQVRYKMWRHQATGPRSLLPELPDLGQRFGTLTPCLLILGVWPYRKRRVHPVLNLLGDFPSFSVVVSSNTRVAVSSLVGVGRVDPTEMTWVLQGQPNCARLEFRYSRASRPQCWIR